MDFSFLNKVIELYKPSFEAYIKDKSVPIEDRWASFLTAPYSIKEHECYGTDLLLDGKDINWYDDFGVERYQTVTADLILDWLYGREDDDGAVISDTVINDMKEQILQKNLGGFEYDR